MTTDLKSIEKVEDIQAPNSELEQIKNNIQSIKTSVEEVKKEMDAFDKEKKTLAKDILDKKQETIDQKKQEIDKKKKETLQLIAKLKQEVVERQKTSIDQKLTDLDKTVSGELDQYEKELNAIDAQSSSFWEKIKEVGSKVWEWAKEHKKPLLIASGVGIAVWGLWKLFGGGKKEKKSKNKEKSGWFGKVLKWGGLALGGVFVWKNWDKISDWFKNLFGKETPPADPYSSDFEKLSPEMKAKYYELSGDIDSFPTSTVVTFDEDADKNKNAKAELIFDLDKNVPNLAEFNTTDTLNYISGETTDDFFDILKNGTKTLAYKALSGFLMRLESFKPFGVTFISDPVKGFDEWLKAGTPEERQKTLSLFYVEYMNILYYVTDKKRIILYKKAKEEIMGASNVLQEPTKDQEDNIKDLIENEEWAKKKLELLRISDIPSLMKTYAIEVSDISQETEAIDQKLLEEKNDVLNTDDEGVSAITRAEEDFEDGKIEQDTRDELIDLCESLNDDLFGNGTKIGFFGAYTHLLTDVFKGNQELLQNYMKETHADDLIDEVKAMIALNIDKLKNNTFTKEDLNFLKGKMDEYFVAKEKFTKHIATIEDSNDSRFAWSKLFNNIFFESFKDVGKAFGLGQTNSWRERIGRGLGGAVVSGGALYVTGTLLKPVAPVAGTILKIGGKTAIKIGTLPVEVMKRGLTKSLGRSFLTGMGWSEAVLNSGFTSQEKQRLIAYAFLHGEISENRALKLFENKNGLGKTLANVDALLKECGIVDPQQVMLFKKYGNNKNIKNLLITFDSDYKYHSTGKNIKNNFVDRILKKQVKVNPDAFKQLGEIDNFLGRCTHQGKAALVNGFLESTKSLKPEMIQELFATQTFDDIAPEVSRNIGRLLGKHMNKFSSLDDFKAFQGFFKRNYVQYPSEHFVRNALSKWGTLRSMDDMAQAKYIESAKLNLSSYERVSIKVKDGVTNMVKNLDLMLKNPKFQPFYNGIKNKITLLSDYAKTITPESIKAMKDINWLDKITGFSKLTPEGIAALKSLNVMLATDDLLLKSLQGAKKLEDVKDILTRAGIDASKIDDGVLLKIVGTKDASKIKNIVNYGSEIESISALKKIFANPAMKAFGKWLGVVGVVADFAFVGIEAFQQFSEAEEIKKRNALRGQNKENEAYFDAITGGTGAVLGLAGFIALAATVGTVNAWNPVGWGCLAGAGLLQVSKSFADLYYGEIDRFRQNYEDFTKKSLPAIKQDIVHINNWQTGLDSSFQDTWSYLTGNLAEEEKKKISVNTSADAVKAIIYFEELQKYPQAIADLNNPEIRKNPDLENSVKQQKDAHQKAVDERFSYIKINYIDKNKPLLSEKELKENKGISALDKLLEDSRIYQTMLADSEYIDKNNVAGYKTYLENELKQNTGAFSKLEDFYSKQPVEFYKMAFGMPQYESLLQQYPDGKANYQELVDGLDYMKKYITYKSLGKLPSDYQKIEFDPNNVDYTQIENFLLNYNLVATGIVKENIKTAQGVDYLDDRNMLDQYNVSRSIGQNVLFEIAQKLGYVEPLYSGKNNLDDLKKFFSEGQKEVNGIYFDGTYRTLNENWGSDNEFATDTELNNIESIIKMRDYIADAANSRTTGKMTGDYETTQEMSNIYLDILDSNIAYRKDPLKIKNSVQEYIKSQSNGAYIQLPSDLLIKAIKSGFKHPGAFVYRWDGKTFETHTNRKNIVSDLVN